MRYYPATGVVSYALSPREKADIQQKMATTVRRVIKFEEQRTSQEIATVRRIDTRRFLRDLDDRSYLRSVKIP